MRLIINHNRYPRVWAVSDDEHWMIYRRYRGEGYVYTVDHWKTDEAKARYIIRTDSDEDFCAQLAVIVQTLFVEIQDMRVTA